MKDNNYYSTSLNAYYQEMGKYPLLSKDEELILVKKIAKGDREARQTLINANLRLVIAIAKHYSHNDRELLDLIQDGNVGLIIAANKYDYQRCNHFSTYATYWIRQSIVRNMVNTGRTIRLPAYLEELLVSYTIFYKKYVSDNLKEPSFQEVAVALNIKECLATKIINIAINKNNIVSLSSPTQEDDQTLEDLIPSQDSLEDIVINNDLSNILANLIFNSGLTRQEIMVLIKSYGLNNTKKYSLDELVVYFGVKKSRIGQIKSQAIKKIMINPQVLKLIDYLNNPEAALNYINTLSPIIKNHPYYSLTKVKKLSS
jgi:RNA polymerase primary sigma factor